MVNIANQNDKSSGDVTHTSTQKHIQSTHSVNDSCATVSEGQAHKSQVSWKASSEKSLHED